MAKCKKKIADTEVKSSNVAKKSNRTPKFKVDWKSIIQKLPGFPKHVPTATWRPILEQLFNRRLKYTEDVYVKCRMFIKNAKNRQKDRV